MLPHYISQFSNTSPYNIMIPNNKKIEFYAPFLIGHVFPLAKLAEVVQAEFPAYEITFITFQMTKQKLQKDFPTLNFIGIQHGFNAEKEKEMVALPPHLLFPSLFSSFKEYFQDKKQLPQLIICDFFAVEAANFAKQNKVKLIVDFPNSFGIRHMLTFVSIERCHIIEGFLVHQQLPPIPMLAPFDAIIDSYRNWGRIMFHTFVGLEDACIKPSNYEFVGLLPNRSSQQLPNELKGWIEGWKAKGKDRFLYVSFGSVLTLNSNFAKKLANIFAELGYPTIWSLRTPEKIALNNPLIYHRQWLPQQAILRLPQVRGYMTHCGWGSITEAITSKTPLICVPVFGDQPENARTVIKKNIGVRIYDTTNLAVPLELNLDIDDDKIIAGVDQVMNDDRYLKSIEKLNRLSELHSAKDNIIRIVSETLEFGNEHLICQKYEDATYKARGPLSKILVKEYLPQPQQQKH